MNFMKKVSILLASSNGARGEVEKKIYSGEIGSQDKDLKSYTFSQIIRVKMAVSAIFKEIESVGEYRNKCQKLYKEFEDSGDIVGAAGMHLEIKDFQDIINVYKKQIATIGRFLIDILHCDIFTEHEMCQLLNINWITWQKEKESYIKQFGEEEDLIYHITAVTGPEYRHRRGRMKDWYDCPRYEMPVYWSIHEAISQRMDEDEEFKKATDKKFKELFPDFKWYRGITDLEGNLIGLLEEKEGDK